MKIEIFGTGCPDSIKLEKNVRKAVRKSKKKIDIVIIDDINEMCNRGIKSIPGLVINGEIKSYGRVDDVDEILGWL